MKKTIVFVGPTLHADVVRAVLPDADVRPPAAVGDILDLALAARRPARIVLIDGYFERMAAVWHKELLLALERGIEVYGAASMGALRAAELARFGMVGHGEVYKAFASGELVADDEVAVAHLPAAQGYRAISDALVNIRASLAAARERRVIKKPAHDRLLAHARGQFYRDRRWKDLVTLEPALAHQPLLDQKATDASRLLGLLAKKRVRAVRALTVPRTWALRHLIAIR
jgi:hypothetical protein